METFKPTSLYAVCILWQINEDNNNRVWFFMLNSCLETLRVVWALRFKN